MKNIVYIIPVIVLLGSCSYFEYDNYDVPDATLQGTVYDAKTGEPLSTETGASFKVEYYELSWEEAGHTNTEARFFWGKGDGSFQNTKIFAGKYRISLKEGAFHNPESSIIDLHSGKITRQDYNVIPYARVKIDEITLAGDNRNNLVIKYTVEDTETEIDAEGMNEDLFILSEARVFISRKSPNVGINNTETVFTLNASKNISNYTPGNPKTYTETNVKGLPSGTWWVRVGVRTGNPQKRYNFTPVQEIIVP
ncbi:MAG: DUF3823 domain-containing protein [Dysgonamonadaceae bacterium]|jgi:hypothetical protein|nr:DUF3823 domain-containing protein [Dysgonamonadaceae bacterium]